MADAATTERLTLGPPPDGYTDGDGPVELVFTASDPGSEPQEVGTFDTLGEAQKEAAVCVDRGFLVGRLDFRNPAGDEATPEPDQEQDADDGPKSPLEAAVVAEQAEYENQAAYAVVFVKPNGTEKTDRDQLTLADARARFDAEVTPGSGRLELRGPDGEILDVKAPHLRAVGDEPIELPADGTPVEAPEGDHEVVVAPPETEVEERRANEETTEPARELETTPPDPDEPAAAAEKPIVEDESGQTQVVDPVNYEREDLALPKIDGQQVDRIAFAFTGQIMLDRSDPADVKLWRKLQLGHDVTLKVEGACAGYTGKQNTNRDGDLDVVVGVRRIKIHTIYMPAGETD